MKNRLEFIQKADMADMFSALQKLYLQEFGISLDLSTSSDFQVEMNYVVTDSTVFPLLKQHGSGFILSADDDLPLILMHYCQEQVRTLNLQQLNQLQKEIENNRMRQTFFETDSENDLKSDAVNKFLDKLSEVVRAQKNQIEIAKQQSAMHHISDILFSKSGHTMVKKLKNFYQVQLGIGVYEQFSTSDPDALQTVLKVEDGYQKIKSLDIPIKEKLNLDTDDLFFILNHYLQTSMAHLDLEDLCKFAMQIKWWNERLTFDSHQDFELARFMGPLQDTLKAKIQTHLDHLFQHNKISMHELALVVTHMDLLTERDGANDIEDYLQTIHDHTHKKTLESMSNQALRQLIQAEKSNEYFQSLSEITISDQVNLLEACELKSYLILLQLKVAKPEIIGISAILDKLTPMIETGMRDFLAQYKTDVKSTVSDRYQTKKLDSIDTMLRILDDNTSSREEKMQQIKAHFEAHSKIHKTESLGRYLYRCLCAFLNKPCHLSQYQTTLFKGLLNEDNASQDLDFKERYKKLT